MRMRRGAGDRIERNWGARCVAMLAAVGHVVATTAAVAQQPAMPQGPSVVSGGVKIKPSGGNGLRINQSTSRAIVNWNSFSIGQGNTVTFNQPGASSAILNRVTGETPSTIAGRLNANGQVFLVNPNGIAITSSGSVNVGGGFVGSTLDIRNQDFMGGVLDFFGGGSSASVSNAGSIVAGAGGFVGMLGGSVSNSGTISVPVGRVGLGSGQRATLDLTGDGFLQVAVPSGVINDRALVDVKGRIAAPGGRVELKAATVRKAIRDAVNVSGVVSARSVSGRDGAIVLGGGEGGHVNVSGTLDAGGEESAGKIEVGGRSVAIDGDAAITAISGSGKGGDVAITASGRIALGDATVAVSGATGGGRVRIGGDVQGTGTLTRAEETSIGADAVIRADATKEGDGGTVIVWSDSLTTFEGYISAQGGLLGGDGGFAEVSGKEKLAFSGFANLSATSGEFGTLLLDPYDITISDAADSNHTGFTASGNDSVINVGTLVAQLGAAHVTVSTGAGGGQSGHITIAAPISWSANTRLTLNAAGDIRFNAPVSASGASAGLVITAGGSYSFGSGASVSLPGASSTLTINGNAYTLIRNVTQLQAMSGNLAGRYALATNIDASATASWNSGAGFVPVGVYNARFTGSFEGLGNTITDFTINRPTQEYVGLFGMVGAVTIGNVLFSNASVKGRQDVGILAGRTENATISGIHASGVVAGAFSSGGLIGTTSSGVLANSHSAVTINGEQYAGGLVGYAAHGTIRGSSATGVVSGSTGIGGLAGYNYRNLITGSHATGNVISSSGDAGGLVGINYEATIEDSYATGNLTNSSAPWIGGLVGRSILGSVIRRSYATGRVQGSSNTGGLVGHNSASTISESYATGNVPGNYISGGLVGQNTAASVIVNSYATGETTGGEYIGGLVGSNLQNSSITSSYATGFVHGNQYVGGLVGNNSNSTITTSYARGGVLAQLYGAGGLVGMNYFSTISMSYSSGGVTVYRDRYSAGGFIGVNNSASNIIASYWSKDPMWSSNNSIGTGSNHDGVQPLTPGQMGDINSFTTNYEGWDFAGTWVPPAYGSLPELYALSRVVVVKAEDASMVYGSGDRPDFSVSHYGGYDTTTGKTLYARASETLDPNQVLAAVQIDDPNASSKSGSGFDRAGSYWINDTDAGPVSSNGGSYRVLVIPGTFTVEKAEITITASGQDKVYDGTAGATVTFSDNRIAGDVLDFSGSAVFDSHLAGTGRAINVTDIAALGADGGNYVFNTTAATAANITPRAITVTANAGQGKVYGGVDPTFTYTVGGMGLVSGETLSGALSRAAGENVGIYAIGQGSLTASSNYTLSFTPGSTFDITSRAITVTPNAGQGKVYGGIDPAFTYTVGGMGLVFGETLSGSLSRTAGENVGSYEIGQGSLFASSNYTLTFTPGATFEITPRPITVAAQAGQSKIYGNGDPTTLLYGITSGTLVDGDAFSGALARDAGENAGTYALGLGSLTLGSNYALTLDAGASFTIDPRSVTVAAHAGQTKIYGETGTALTYGIVSGSIVGSDAFSGALGRDAGENVGTYAISMGSLSLGSNYALSLEPGSTYAITPRPITVTAEGHTKIYGDADPEFSYTVGGMGLAFSDELVGALSRYAGEDSGWYMITLGSVAASANYDLSYEYTGFIIMPRAIIVSPLEGQGKIYGNADPTLNYEITSGALVDGDAFSGALTRDAGENVGAYEISQGSLSLGYNYTLGFTQGTTFAVTPREITVAAVAGQSKIYGNADPALSYGITSGTLVNGDTFSGALARAAGENVAAYAILQGSLSLGGNYALTFTPGTTFAIAPRSLHIAPVAGHSKVYGSADPTLSYTIGGMGLAFGDQLSGALSRTAGENVGVYDIGLGTLAASANYDLSLGAETFAITQRAVTVAALAGQNKIYGNVDPTLSYAITSGTLVDGDGFLGTLGRAAGENVGTYAVTQGSLSLGSNYALTFTPGTTFSIAPRSIHIAPAAGQSKVYGNTDPTLSYTIGGLGLAFGDQLSGSLARATGENVGSYAIGLGTLAASANYELSFGSGTSFGITPRAITVSANAGQSKIYGNVDPTLVYAITSGTLVDGDAFSGSLLRAAGEDVGAHAIAQGSLGLSSNYALTFTPGTTFSITPRSIHIAPVAGQAKEYGNADSALAYSIGGLGIAFGDHLSGALSRIAGENVGSYDIGLGTLAASANYDLSFTSGTSFAITPRAITVSALSGQHKIYGDVDPSLLYEIASGTLVDGDAFAGTLARAAGENAGAYAISQGSLALGSNYALTVTPGTTFAITPRPIHIAPVAGQTKIYGNANTTLSYTIGGMGLVFGDQLSGALGRTAGEYVGSYAIDLGTLAASANYDLSFNTGATFAITPRAVTVAALAGHTKIYGNVDPTLSYAITSGTLVHGDGFSGTLGRTAGEDVGIYAVSQGSLSLGSNYALTFTPGTTFSVTPRPIHVTPVTGQSKIYGDANPAIAYTVSGMGLAFGDQLRGALSRAAGENVGLYEISHGTLAASSNYTLTFSAAFGEFAIVPRALRITVNDVTKTRDGTPFAGGDGVTYEGFAHSDNAADLSGALVFGGAAQGAVEVGQYSLTASGLSSDNYVISYVPGTLVIDPPLSMQTFASRITPETFVASSSGARDFLALGQPGYWDPTPFRDLEADQP